MSNVFGKNISVTIFGESHGPLIGATVGGIEPGIKINKEYISEKLSKRRPFGKISTARREADEFRIVSGEFNGYTTGAPLTIIIENSDTKSRDYSEFLDTPRPSHADFTANVKYRGFQDYRGGGHFSGRITAPLVAVGAILQCYLEEKGIYIGTHIKSLKGIYDREFSDYSADIKLLSRKLFPTLSEKSEKEMLEFIEKTAEMGDSVGGVLESAVIGVPAGLGEPFFDSVESEISHILFSIPAVKGVSFGRGFGFSELLGSEANDAFETDGAAVYTKTNNNGGILGGISTGMPIIVNTAIKPTPSIFKEQESVSLSTLENKKLTIKGRHDPAIIHRARAVVDAALAIAIYDLILQNRSTT